MHFRSQVYNTEFSFKSTMSWTFHKRHRLKLIEDGGNKCLCVLLTTQQYLTWLRRNISMSFLNLSAWQNFSLVMETAASNLSFFFFSIHCCILRTPLLFPPSLQRQEGLVVVQVLHQLAQPVAPSALYTCFQSNMTLEHAGAKSSNGEEAAHCTERNEHISSEGCIYK